MANGSVHGRRARQFPGRQLNRRRRDMGSTRVESGARVLVSGGHTGQVEQATRKPQPDMAQRTDEVLRTEGFCERLWLRLIKEQRHAELSRLT